MKRNVKIFCAALALVLVFGAVVGGTLAWLQDTTNTVTNTFTVGNVDIDLYEHKLVDGELDDEHKVTSQELKMVPGATISKDPTVVVAAESEACWLFVKVDEINNTAEDIENDLIIWSAKTGWTNVPEVEGVYYRSVDYSDAAQTFEVLADNAVTVNGNITQEYMNSVTASLTDENTNDDLQPKLEFTAYAIQSDNLPDSMDATAIWNEYFSNTNA